jgi:predicted transcriptional regulator
LSTVRESLWIALDGDLVRALDDLAKAKGITRHEAARVALRLGLELVRQQKGRAERIPTFASRPTR